MAISGVFRIEFERMDNSIAVYWILKGPDGRLLRCELVHTAGRLEVRAVNGHAPRCQEVRAESDGLNVAAAWKAQYLAKGWGAIDDAPSESGPAASQQFKIDRSTDGTTTANNRRRTGRCTIRATGRRPPQMTRAAKPGTPAMRTATRGVC